MPRNMSFAMTTKQVRNRTKTVTRRKGWAFLKPGDIVNAVEKSMGLKKGEKVVRICQIRVVSIELNQRLNEMPPEDCAKEGFPGWSVYRFASFITQQRWISARWEAYNRIEFEYLD